MCPEDTCLRYTELYIQLSYIGGTRDRRTGNVRICMNIFPFITFKKSPLLEKREKKEQEIAKTFN
jgi:hypothetical protein